MSLCRLEGSVSAHHLLRSRDGFRRHTNGIAACRDLVGQSRADLVHLDAALRLFASDMDPAEIRAKQVQRSDGWFENGAERP
jgi:hypothetical protein